VPTYVYRCEQGHTFELFHAISDESAKRCPECGAAAKRVPAGGAGFLFKGSGFYITDYRSKGYKESAKKEGSPGAAGSSGSGAADKPAASDGGSTPGSSPGAPSAPGAEESKPAKPEAGSGSKPEA
jgi:putative FmdB family regulatory protein